MKKNSNVKVRSRKIKLASVQLASQQDFNIPWNRSNSEVAASRFLKLVEEAGRKKADIVCMPELSNMFYKTADEAAEKVPGHTFNKYAKLASKYRMYIVLGFLQQCEGYRRNSAIFIGRDGSIVGQYHKIHTCPNEAPDWGVRAGDKWHVFDLDFGRVGAMICYDNRFPESARCLALEGAEVIFYPLMGEEMGYDNWVCWTRTRAFENSVYVVSSVLGPPSARSMIVGPSGDVLACGPIGHQDALVMAEVDLETRVPIFSFNKLVKKRPGQAPGWKKILLATRRPDTYSILLKPPVSLKDVVIRNPKS